MTPSSVSRSSFSIIIPTNNRAALFPRAFKSIQNQCYPKDRWELILVDDGSQDNTFQIWLELIGANVSECIHWIPPIGEDHLKREYFKFENYTYIQHPERYERVISRTDGMKVAKNDWILWLDSDDELLSTTLSNVDYWIRKCPEYSMFHWGGVVYWEPKDPMEPDYEPRSTLRPTAELQEEGEGMAPFDSGLVATGHFTFKREILSDVGYLPQEMSPYTFTDRCVEMHPEFLAWMKARNVDTLGNPWGCDFVTVYHITRKYKTKGLPLSLYLQHVRR